LEEALRETEVGDGKAMFRKSGQNFWLAWGCDSRIL
jgi:hypothetical protein